MQPLLRILSTILGGAEAMAWLELFHCKEGRAPLRMPASWRSTFYLLPDILLPIHHLTLTETFWGPVTPLGAASLAVMAGEDATARQHKTLVTYILHGGPHRKLGAGYEASAVLHIPRVMTGSH